MDSHISKQDTNQDMILLKQKYMHFNRLPHNLIILALLLAGYILHAQNEYLAKGTGPKYWIAYEYCYDNNIAIPEDLWKSNIDWVNDNLKSYGYDMVCNDGWIEAAQTINENGYVTKYNSGWQHDFVYWSKYLSDRKLKTGIYYNPMWITAEAYKQNAAVLGTNFHIRDIVGDRPFNDALHWVDASKPGAREWVKGYVSYFKNIGATYLRVDFLENYENNYGTANYNKVLGWIHEAAGDSMFISLVMPNCYNHAETELKYGDMIRVSDDCFIGDWQFVSDRRRGERKTNWPQFGNLFDGMVAFANVGAKNKMVLDGDFMRMNKLASDNERKFLFSLMVMGGAALAIADQFNTIGTNLWVYQNKELNALNEQGFIAKPLSYSNKDVENSSRWIGQLENGDWIVGLFNRESTPQTRNINFKDELGIADGKAKNVRDLWEHKDFGGMSGSYAVLLAPHECKIIRVSTALKKE